MHVFWPYCWRINQSFHKQDQTQEWKKVVVVGGKAEKSRARSVKHVFTFTAEDGTQYIFRAEHKPKKKRWIRYLNEAAFGASFKLNRQSQ